MAQRFAQQCPFDDKAEQIRRNTLAVCAVNSYFQLMDIPTALGESDSWNTMMQMMANVADIKVPTVGTFSCRVVEAEASRCYIPPEDWQGRTGYIAVELDERMQQATLVGFMAAVPTQEWVALDRFSPIESLIERVAVLQTTSAAEQAGMAVQSVLTRLGDWAEGAIANGWQAVDTLINPAAMTFAFRGEATEAEPSVHDLSQAKLVDLGIQLAGDGTEQPVQVALVIHLTHSDESPPEAADRTDIILQVRPQGESPYLMEGLTLTVLDADENVFMSATSRAIDNYIQLQLSGQPNEQFSVQIALGDRTFKEQFVI